MEYINTRKEECEPVAERVGQQRSGKAKGAPREVRLWFSEGGDLTKELSMGLPVTRPPPMPR